jgi:hypothetical protein
MTTIAAGVLPLLTAAAIVAAPQLEQAPPPRAVDVAALVKQLGSDDFAEREAATRRLSALVLDPPPELLAATRSESPEVRGRAATAAESMRRNVALVRMPRGEQFARQSKVDLFVAATAVWDLKPEDRRLWEPALDLGRRLIAKADMTKQRKPNGCPAAYKDYETFQDLKSPRYARVDQVYVRKDADTLLLSSYNEAIQAPAVAEPKAIGGSLVVSRGSVSASSAIAKSVVLANGDISARTITYDSILVCDGNVTITEGEISRCVVVARGNISAAEGADTSVLMAGGKVRLGKERVTKRQAESGHYNVIVEGEPNTLGLAFFELATVGVVVKLEGGEVTVANFKVQSAFAAAGVEIGDVITAVNGKKPDSAESLRRLLRDALALGDAAVVVRRGDATETLKVSLPE